MSTGWHCPIVRHGGLCDREALYIVDGTTLCRDHAREAIEKRDERQG